MTSAGVAAFLREFADAIMLPHRNRVCQARTGDDTGCEVPIIRLPGPDVRRRRGRRVDHRLLGRTPPRRGAGGRRPLWVGGATLLVGLLMLVLPGPGIPVTVAGLSLLATRVPLARLWLARLRRWAAAHAIPLAWVTITMTKPDQPPAPARPPGPPAGLPMGGPTPVPQPLHQPWAEPTKR